MPTLPRPSVPAFIETSMYVLIFAFLWRLAAAGLADTPLGRAMAAVFS